MSQPNLGAHSIKVAHVRITTAKSFAEVEAALEKLLPKIDQEILEALAEGELERAKRLGRGCELFIFGKRDHGILLRSAGQTRRAVQYEIGNPITAASMTQYQLSAALYAPLRVLLFQKPSEEGATFEYDLPSSLFGQFGDERVTAVGEKLDAELERVLRRAAS